MARRALWLSLAALLGLAGLVLAGLVQALSRPEVVAYSRPLPGLASGTLRVVLLSDTHGGRPAMPRARLETIVAQVNALRPDLVVLLGDYHEAMAFDWPGRDRLEDSLAPFAALRAPLGVFAVRGNHDNSWTARLLAGSDRPRLLLNQWVDVGPVVVAGMDSITHRQDMARTLAGVPADKPVLLLMHEPETLMFKPLPRRLVLGLAGHTHGGQAWWPWIGAPASWRWGQYPCRRGPCRIGAWEVVVTSGIGTSGLPLRFNVRPEIVVLSLYPSTGRKSGTER